MAQFIAVCHRNLEHFSASDFTPELLEEEAERVRQLYADGTFRHVWGRADNPGAVIVIEASSPDEAEAVLASLPLAIREMLTLDVLVPVTPYRGFGPRG
ncbi:MAG TPA: muconolactone Delta-isomerase family protein [Candidatus Elarobacter sp.]|nr:muconolactone Delta-isomerase family protein [Candidatus Elarobacter sp.]